MAWTTPRTWVAGETVTSGIFNSGIRDELNWLYSGEPWVFPTLLSSWVDYAPASYGVARYRRVSAWVEMAGLIKSGTTGTAIFTLPVGYRPTRNVIVSVIGSGVPSGNAPPGAPGYTELRVLSTGDVAYNVVQNNGYCSLFTRWLVA